MDRAVRRCPSWRARPLLRALEAWILCVEYVHVRQDFWDLRGGIGRLKALDIMVKKLLALSPAEWRLMSSIWDLRVANPLQLSEYFRTHLGEELSPKTAGILLARLEEKAYLRSEPSPPLAGRGRPPYFYTAVISRDEALRRVLEKFLRDHRLTDDHSFSLLKVLLAQLEAQLVEPSPAG